MLCSEKYNNDDIKGEIYFRIDEEIIFYVFNFFMNVKQITDKKYGIFIRNIFIYTRKLKKFKFDYLHTVYNPKKTAKIELGIK